MFIFRAGVVQELRTHAEIIIPLENKGQWLLPHLPKTSDYALMERLSWHTYCQDFGWDDLGIGTRSSACSKGMPNVELANHVGLDTQGTILYATGEEDVIVTIGLEDVVIVRDRNVTLIVKKTALRKLNRYSKPCKMTQNSQISCKVKP